MSAPRDYEDIPGTYVYDAERGRVGYHLNMFCMSLNKPENRAAFKANEAPTSTGSRSRAEQKEAVLKRDWLGMLQGRRQHLLHDQDRVLRRPHLPGRGRHDVQHAQGGVREDDAGRRPQSRQPRAISTRGEN